MKSNYVEIGLLLLHLQYEIAVLLRMKVLIECVFLEQRKNSYFVFVLIYLCPVFLSLFPFGLNEVRLTSFVKQKIIESD